MKHMLIFDETGKFWHYNKKQARLLFFPHHPNIRETSDLLLLLFFTRKQKKKDKKRQYLGSTLMFVCTESIVKTYMQHEIHSEQNILLPVLHCVSA